MSGHMGHEQVTTLNGVMLQMFNHGLTAATLFWFNPLVWLLEREIVQQAEEAADCEAAKRVEPARYAQTLLTWAQIEARSLPAHSIAPKGSALGRRVKAILDRRIRERQSGSAWTAFAIVLCVAIAAPVALRNTQGSSTNPPSGSQTRPSVPCMVRATACMACRGVPPSISTPAAAAMPAADNDSAASEAPPEPRRGWWQKTFG